MEYGCYPARLFCHSNISVFVAVSVWLGCVCCHLVPVELVFVALVVGDRVLSHCICVGLPSHQLVHQNSVIMRDTAVEM